MLSATLAKTIPFPVKQKAAAKASASWIIGLKQRLQRRQQADAVCLVH